MELHCISEPTDPRKGAAPAAKSASPEWVGEVWVGRWLSQENKELELKRQKAPQLLLDVHFHLSPVPLKRWKV